MKRYLWIAAWAILVSTAAIAQTPPVVTILSPDEGVCVDRRTTVGIGMSVASDYPLYAVEIAVRDQDDNNVWICDYPFYPGPGPFYCAWPVPAKPHQSYEIYFYANSIDESGDVYTELPLPTLDVCLSGR
jgi:hypothetical protein